MGKTTSVSGKAKTAVSTDDFDISFYKDIVESAPIPIWIKDTDSRIIRFSKGAGELFGKLASDIGGRSLDKWLSKADSAQSRKEDRAVIRSKKPILNIFRTFRYNDHGKLLVLQLKKFPSSTIRGKSPILLFMQTT